MTDTSTWYNTTKEENKEELDKKAFTQEEQILEVFKQQKRELAPFEVQTYLMNRYPITSIRRGITNLTWKLNDELKLF